MKEKHREEIGYKDMQHYENGGLEVLEKLHNGYSLYIPYGIHCDVFEAMQAGIVGIQKQLEHVRKISKDCDIPFLKYSFENQIQQLEKHIDVLQHIQGIYSEI